MYLGPPPSNSSDNTRKEKLLHGWAEQMLDVVQNFHIVVERWCGVISWNLEDVLNSVGKEERRMGDWFEETVHCLLLHCWCRVEGIWYFIFLV